MSAKPVGTTEAFFFIYLRWASTFVVSGSNTIPDGSCKQTTSNKHIKCNTSHKERNWANIKGAKYWLPTFDASTTSEIFSENPLINVFKQEDVRLSMSRRLPTLLATNLDICFLINLIIYLFIHLTRITKTKTCLPCLLVVDQAVGLPLCESLWERRWQTV